MRPLMRGRVPFASLIGLAVMAPSVPAFGAVECQLCSQGDTKSVAAAPRRTLRIEIDSLLDFSTAAHSDAGDGSIEVDARTGLRRVTGGLIGLGGFALRGTVRVTGEPFARVKVDFPRTMAMHSTMGATATISHIETTLSADPTIGADGQLIFSFGARMTVDGGAAGEFNGRFPIVADYQ